MIYFIEAVGTPYVKIGRTRTSVKSRMSALATGCPYPLQVVRLIAINQKRESKIEKQLHRKFKKFRSQGEWFAVTADQIIEAIHAIVKVRHNLPPQSFAEYLAEQVERRGFIGDLARDATGDNDFKGMTKFTQCRELLSNFGACDGAYRALVMAWIEYRRIKRGLVCPIVVAN